MATSRDEVGSIVEQSMKRRSVVLGSENLILGSGGWRMLWKTFLTWEGSGRAVMTTSCHFEHVISQMVLCFDAELMKCGGAQNAWVFRGLALILVESEQELRRQTLNLDHCLGNRIHHRIVGIESSLSAFDERERHIQIFRPLL